MDETVDALLDLDEGAEVGEALDHALEALARGVVGVEHLPRIRIGLLHPQGDLLRFLVELEDDDLDEVADGYQLRGMAHVLGPRHFRDVNEAFDPLLELDESAVVGDADHLALGLRALGETLVDHLPWMRRQLLEPEGDALAFAVVVEDLDLDAVADGDHLGRMADAAPGHVGDVQQTVDAPQVDEGAEIP